MLKAAERPAKAGLATEARRAELLTRATEAIVAMCGLEKASMEMWEGGGLRGEGERCGGMGKRLSIKQLKRRSRQLEGEEEERRKK